MFLKNLLKKLYHKIGVVSIDSYRRDVDVIASTIVRDLMSEHIYTFKHDINYYIDKLDENKDEYDEKS